MTNLWVRASHKEFIFLREGSELSCLIKIYSLSELFAIFIRIRKSSELRFVIRYLSQASQK